MEFGYIRRFCWYHACLQDRITVSVLRNNNLLRNNNFFQHCPLLMLNVAPMFLVQDWILVSLFSLIKITFYCISNAIINLNGDLLFYIKYCWYLYVLCPFCTGILFNENCRKILYLWWKRLDFWHWNYLFPILLFF